MGGKKGPYADKPYYRFKSSCCGLHSEGFLGMVNFYCTGSKDEKNNNFLLGAKLMETLAELMIDDKEIREYVRSMPHPTLRYNNYMQSFVPTLEEMKIEIQTRLNADEAKTTRRAHPTIKLNWELAMAKCDYLIQLYNSKTYDALIGYDKSGRA